MKRIISLLLIVVFALSTVSCGAVNKTEVAVLWHNMADEFTAELADAVDRAMYIENIKYSHYDAEGNADAQIAQAKAAIEAGAPALLVNCETSGTAAAIIGLASDADIPVVFIGSNITASVLDTYSKCVSVELDYYSLYTVLAEKIAADLIENYDDYDRNGDGKISYTAYGLSGECVPEINELLRAEEKAELVMVENNPTVSVTESINALFAGYDGSGKTVNETPVELILTDDDAIIEEMLIALRAYQLNFEKLVTHFIPLYTVGAAANAGNLLVYAEKQEERDAYSVMNAIDNGYLSAAALEDDDTLAESAARILRNLLKGKDTFTKIDEDLIVGKKISVKYTIY